MGREPRRAAKGAPSCAPRMTTRTVIWKISEYRRRAGYLPGAAGRMTSHLPPGRVVRKKEKNGARKNEEEASRAEKGRACDIARLTASRPRRERGARLVASASVKKG